MGNSSVQRSWRSVAAIDQPWCKTLRTGFLRTNPCPLLHLSSQLPRLVETVALPRPTPDRQNNAGDVSHAAPHLVRYLRACTGSSKAALPISLSA